MSDESRHTLEQKRNRFSNWKKKRSGREYLAVLFVECKGRCPKCQQLMILSYEDKTYTNRATFNHKIRLADMGKEKEMSNLDILCWTCNTNDGIEAERNKPTNMIATV